MAENRTPDSDSSGSVPSVDPGHVISYLLSGVIAYGLIGWALDKWLGTTWIVAVGIVVGAGLGIYMTWRRFGGATPQQHNSDA